MRLGPSKCGGLPRTQAAVNLQQACSSMSRISWIVFKMTGCSPLNHFHLFESRRQKSSARNRRSYAPDLTIPRPFGIEQSPRPHKNRLQLPDRPRARLIKRPNSRLVGRKFLIHRPQTTSSPESSRLSMRNRPEPYFLVPFISIQLQRSGINSTMQRPRHFLRIKQKYTPARNAAQLAPKPMDPPPRPPLMINSPRTARHDRNFAR